MGLTLSESRSCRLSTFCALYVAQGIPWGFMLISLPAYLASEFQLDDTEIGNLKAIILIPWSFKLIWAPIMDNFTIRSMGKRRPWIIGAEILMAASLLTLMGLGDLSEKMRLLLWIYLIHNCFSSLQDVCTDALAVDMLPPEEQGLTNGLMWGSKLVGKGLGAGGLSWVLSNYNLEACVAIQIVLLLGIMCFPLFVLERPGDRRFPWSDPVPSNAIQEDESSWKNEVTLSDSESEDSSVQVFKAQDIPESEDPQSIDWSQFFNDYVRAFRLRTTAACLFFSVIMSVGYGVFETATTTLYTQELGWSDVEYSSVAGTFSVPLVILGTLVGYLIVDRLNSRKLILYIGFGGLGLTSLVFAMSSGMWQSGKFAGSYLVLTEGFQCIASIGFLAMSMRITWTAAAATVFTTFMPMSNVSHVFGNWFAGRFREWVLSGELEVASVMTSYQYTILFVGLVSLLPLLLVPLMNPPEVDLAKQEDSV